jgi:hypothetical protein
VGGVLGSPFGLGKSYFDPEALEAKSRAQTAILIFGIK